MLESSIQPRRKALEEAKFIMVIKVFAKNEVGSHVVLMQICVLLFADQVGLSSL